MANYFATEERDEINDWLTAQGVLMFDPQIHPDTHGVEYDYATHHPLELAARNASKVNLYEISPRTFGGITCLELAMDHFRYQEPMVIYFSDGRPDEDRIPVHTAKGHPLFEPDGIKDSTNARHAHYREFIKNGNRMRKFLMSLAGMMDTLTVTFGEPRQSGDVMITPTRLHAADLFKAVVRSASHERVTVYFTGGPEARDKRGNPLFLVPENPPEIELNALLDEYRDEGNHLRRLIAQLVEINVYVRVVYTQKAVIQALSELLKQVSLIA